MVFFTALTTSLTLLVLFFTATPLQASVVDAEQISGGFIRAQGGDFSSSPYANVGLIGKQWGIHAGDGLISPSLLTGDPAAALMTDSRFDRQLFMRESLTAFDAIGEEADNPMAFSEKPIWTVIETGHQPLFADAAKLNINSGGLDRFAVFGFSSMASTLVYRVPLPATVWFALTAVLGIMALKRKPGGTE